MLKVNNICITFNKGTVNEKKALTGVNLVLNEGDFVTIIGGNGAGKSTMLNAVAGAWPIDQGEITIDGHSIKADPIACKRELAYIPDNPDLYEYLSGIRYLNFVADVFGVESKKRNEVISALAG